MNDQFISSINCNSESLGEELDTFPNGTDLKFYAAATPFNNNNNTSNVSNTRSISNMNIANNTNNSQNNQNDDQDAPDESDSYYLRVNTPSAPTTPSSPSHSNKNASTVNTSCYSYNNSGGGGATYQQQMFNRAQSSCFYETQAQSQSQLQSHASPSTPFAAQQQQQNCYSPAVNVATLQQYHHHQQQHHHQLTQSLPPPNHHHSQHQNLHHHPNHHHHQEVLHTPSNPPLNSSQFLKASPLAAPFSSFYTSSSTAPIQQQPHHNQQQPHHHHQHDPNSHQHQQQQHQNIPTMPENSSSTDSQILNKHQHQTNLSPPSSFSTLSSSSCSVNEGSGGSSGPSKSGYKFSPESLSPSSCAAAIAVKSSSDALNKRTTFASANAAAVGATAAIDKFAYSSSSPPPPPTHQQQQPEKQQTSSSSTSNCGSTALIHGITASLSDSATTTTKSGTQQNPTATKKTRRQAPTLATGRRNLKSEPVDPDEADRRCKRRERNRKSAQKCRERKVQITLDLQHEMEQLKSREMALKRSLTAHQNHLAEVHAFLRNNHPEVVLPGKLAEFFSRAQLAVALQDKTENNAEMTEKHEKKQAEQHNAMEKALRHQIAAESIEPSSHGGSIMSDSLLFDEQNAGSAASVSASWNLSGLQHSDMNNGGSRRHRNGDGLDLFNQPQQQQHHHSFQSSDGDTDSGGGVRRAIGVGSCAGENRADGNALMESSEFEESHTMRLAGHLDEDNDEEVEFDDVEASLTLI